MTNLIENSARIQERRAKAPTRKVGFYGCLGGVVRLESVGWFPWHVRITCPACKHEHVVKPFWRKWMASLDKDKQGLDITGYKPDA